MRTTLLLLTLLYSCFLSSQIAITDVLNTGTSGSNPSELTLYNNSVYFTAEVSGVRNVYIYDGTTVTAITNENATFTPKELTVLNGNLYFSGDDGSGRFLYEINASSATTASKLTYSTAYDPKEYIEANGNIYFAGTTGLFSYDGSAIVELATYPAGVSVLTPNDLNMEDPYSEKALIFVNDKLFFHSSQGLYGYELLQSNPIVIWCDVIALQGNEYNLTSINNRVVYTSTFNATPAYELISVNSNTPNDYISIQVNGLGFSSIPKHYITYDNTLFFMAKTGGLNDIFITDGITTTQVTTGLSDGTNGQSFDDNLKIINGKLFWANQEILGSSGSYSLDGASCFSYPYFERNALFLNNQYYSVGIDGSSSTYGIHKCDDTSSGVITCHTANDNAITEIMAYNGEVFYISNDDAFGVEIFSTTSDGSGLCYENQLNDLSCIELIGKVKLDTAVSAVGNYSILTHNEDGYISSIPSSSLSTDDADADPTNEFQNLSISGSNISISDGNTITLPTSTGDDLGNHTATTNIDANSNSINNLATPTAPNDAATKAYVDAISVDDADADPTNEFQNLSINGSDISISDGNTITLPSPNSNILEDADSDTKVLAEESTDIDKIAILLEGTKYYELDFRNNNPTFNILNAPNIVFGEGAGQSLTTDAEDNFFFGKLAGKSVTDGTGNFAIGENALLELQVQSNNIAIGNNALQNIGITNLSTLRATQNIAIGNDALKVNPEGYENIAIGHAAMANSVDARRSVAIGVAALIKDDGYSNVGVGRIAGFSNTIAHSNTYIGDQAGYQVTTGSLNTLIGRNSGYELKTGNFNVALGMDAGVESTYDNISNSAAIGYLARNTASNQVVLGNTTTSEICGTVDFTVHSDSRIKENVNDNVVGLNFINGLRPVSYNVNYQTVAEMIGEESPDRDQEAKLRIAREAKSQKTEYGFIAQEVEQLTKDLDFEFQGVHIPESPENLYRISYSTFVVPLVKATQELSDKNDELEKENQELKAQLDDILKRLADLEKK